MQSRRTIIQHQFKHRPSVAKPLHARRDNPAENGRTLPQLKLTNGAKPAPILVASGGMEQKIAEGPDPQAFQLVEPFRSDAPRDGHRRFEGTTERSGFTDTGWGTGDTGSFHAAKVTGPTAKANPVRRGTRGTVRPPGVNGLGRAVSRVLFVPFGTRRSFVSAADTRDPPAFAGMDGPSRVPYLALLPMRFSVPRISQCGRWALTPPFHPDLRPCDRRRFVFCGTVCRNGLSPEAPAVMPAFPNFRPVQPVSSASRPVEFGLSSRGSRPERSPALPRPLRA